MSDLSQLTDLELAAVTGMAAVEAVTAAETRAITAEAKLAEALDRIASLEDALDALAGARDERLREEGRVEERMRALLGGAAPPKRTEPKVETVNGKAKCRSCGGMGCAACRKSTVLDLIEEALPK